MDLSIYYRDFESTYHLAVFVVCLAVFVTLFIVIRTIMDKKEKRWNKIAIVAMLIVILGFVFAYFFKNAYPCKKDIDQQTILYYEGNFEILEITYGLKESSNGVTLVIDKRELHLEYVTVGEKESNQIQVGKQTGKLVYAKYREQLLYIEADELNQ